MRILLVHNFYGSAAPSGENQVFEAEKTLLQSRGHEVAEFTRRLKLSPFFTDVYWQQTTPQQDGPGRINYVGFDLRCKVNY